MKKILIILPILICGFLLIGNSAYAQPINFGNGGPIFIQVPSENSAPINQLNPNIEVEIHLPQNGAAVISGILSNNNFTTLQNNVATMTVFSHTSNLTPTLNYCPMAKYILTNQGVPEYLNRIYNQTSNKDITALVYPAYCHIETGKNPINGDNSIPVPEFSNVVIFVLMGSIITMSLLIGSFFKGRYTW